MSEFCDSARAELAVMCRINRAEQTL